MLFAAFLAFAGVAKAQPEAGKEYRIKESAQGLYLTISGYNGTGETGGHGTVPLLGKSTGNHDQVWTLEATDDQNVYLLKSKSGYYVSQAAWNVNAYRSNANAKVQFVSNGDTYKIKNMNAVNTPWWKTQSVSDVWYPFCDQTDENAAASWILEEVPADEFEFKMSTDENKYFYYIKNARQNKYANYDGDGAFSETAATNIGSYWYFVDATSKLPEGTEVPEGFVACYIFNAVTGKAVQNVSNGFMNDIDASQYPAKIYYIREHSNDGHIGYAIHNYSNDQDAWNDLGGNSVTSYKYDDAGSIWHIFSAEKTEADLLAEAKPVVEKMEDLLPAAKESSYYSYTEKGIVAIEAAIASFDENNLASALTSAMTIGNAQKTGAPVVGDIIMLKNKNVNKYLIDTVVEDVKKARVETANKEDKALWKVVAGENGVKLQNYETGRFLGSMAQSEATLTVEAETDAAEYVWTNPADVYAAFNFVGSNQYGHESWSNLVGWWDKNANASQWVVTNVRPLSITYLLDGKSVKETTEYAKVGTVNIESPFEYSVVKSCTVNDEALEAVDGAYSFVVEGVTKVVVEIEENLPFKTTTITSEGKFAENTEWYVVQQRNANDIWVYDTTEGATANVAVKKGQNFDIYNDTHLWCFTGNIVDGFKIFNKAAGVSYSLDNDAPAQLKKDNEAVWTIEPSDKAFAETDIRLAFKRTAGDKNYANEQGNTLKGYSLDAGSTSRLISVSAETKKIAALWSEWLNKEVGVAGGLESIEGLQELIDAYLAAPTKDNADAVEAFINDGTIALTAGYYFIKGTGEMNDDPSYVVPGSNKLWYATHYVNDGKNLMKAVELQEGEKLNANHVWKLETIEDEEGYKLQQVNLGTYANLIAAAGTSTVEADYANGDKFTFAFDYGRAIIKNGNGAVMRTENDGRINYWGKESHETWYLIPVAELEISINEFASICMPFDVEVEGAQAYAVTATATESVTLTEKADIPAREGAILEGNGVATLKLTTATSNWDDNLLEGTTVDSNIEEVAYVLANGTKGIGLYKAKKNVSTNTENDTEGETFEAFKNFANKAYLPASVVVNANAAMFAFGRGAEDDEESTGIESVELNGELVIYDLAGRRVQKMEKGIYIVNGKKVVIK